MIHSIKLQLEQEILFQGITLDIRMEPDSNTNTPTGRSKMKCGDMLVTCSVAGNTESGIAPVLLQPLLLFELNVREPVKQPGKLIQDYV